MSTYINIFTYNRPVKCNVHILNFRKAPVKVFDLVIIKIPKTSIIIPLWPSYYIPQNPQNTICQTSLKYWNQFNRQSWVTKIVKNHHRYMKEPQSWNWSQGKRPATTRLNYDWNHSIGTTKISKTIHHYFAYDSNHQ